MRWTDLVDGAKQRVSSKLGFLICSAVQRSAPRRVVVRALWGGDRESEKPPFCATLERGQSPSREGPGQGSNHAVTIQLSLS